MKVLFLDIDGVLNSSRSCWALGGYPHDFSEKGMRQFDMVAVGLIRKLCEETGAKIVLSSTWRLMHKPEAVAVGLGLPVIDRTPALNGPRGNEIALWLARHPEVRTYAIVDDDSDMLPEQKPHFVQTNFQNGLLMDDYSELKHKLNNGSAG